MVRTSILLSLAAAAASTFAAKSVKNVVPGAFIFELEDGHDPAAFEQSVGKDGSTRMKLNYDLFKGVSVQLHDVDKAEEKAAKLAAQPAVKNVYPVQLYPMPNPRVDWIEGGKKGGVDTKTNKLSARADEKDEYPPHVMTQIDMLHEKGITGKGVKIAVVDTGIDYKHPALGGCFGKGCLVAFGTDLVGDAYTGSNTPHPDPDPMDCGGHGSHVAGIVAAQQNGNKYNFTGAAPGATLGAYRVFGCAGQAGNDVLIAAFNQAYQDGANIITASIGGPSGWSEEPWAEAVSRIVDKGVPCTVSAGNEGASGLFYASTAANGRTVTAIASYDNTVTPQLLYNAKYQIDNAAEKEFGFVPSEPAEWNGVTLPAYATSYDMPADDACNPLPDNTPDLSKYIVLIRRGSCNFAVKVNHAIDKGAQYVIVYDNGGGAIPMALDGVDLSKLKAASMTTVEYGKIFIDALKAGKKVTLKMVNAEDTDTQLTVANNTATAGALSDFTTWGPTWEMDLKPQFGAVGGKILSTYPRALGSYAVLSGTSMSCPQTAGIIALIHEVRGTFDPELIQNLLSANANPQLFNYGGKFYDFLTPVAQQGGGIVQAYDAAYATTLLSPSGLSFNDTDHFKKTMKFKISNTGKKSITYKVSNVPAITMYTLAEGSIKTMPFPNEPVEVAATLKFSETSVTLGAGQSKTISVSPTPPEGLDAKRLALWSGWVAINGTDGTSLSLPYQGLVGSLHKSTVLDAKDTYISKSTDRPTAPQAPAPVPPNSTFVIPGPGNAGFNDTLPQLSVDLTLGSILLRADVQPMTTCPPKNMTKDFWGYKSIGQPYGFPARWNTRGVSNFPWDGRLDDGNYAPPGKYRFIVRALRIFGDEKKKSDYDVSVSPSFYLKYE